MKENDIDFVEEYRALQNRSFCIDIAFPYKKVGLEVNGNQHYNSDLTLKQYYQSRHSLLEAAGWKIFEIHCSLVYKEKFVVELLSKLKFENAYDFDYS